MGLVLISAPAAEPVSLVDLKNHARIDVGEDETWLDEQRTAAREHCETLLRRQFVTATWKLTLDEWPCDRVIRLPRPPLQSVTSITYVDPDGETQTLSTSDYLVDTTCEPGTVTEAVDSVWPATKEQPAAIAVTYVAGYGAASAVPQGIKAGIRQLVAFWYDHRGLETIPPGIRHLLNPYAFGDVS